MRVTATATRYVTRSNAVQAAARQALRELILEYDRCLSMEAQRFDTEAS